jgi:hypothetical protein
MSHLYLPAEHTDADLVLASQVADAVDSEELFVAWMLDGGVAAAPEVHATLSRHEPPLNPFAEALSGIIASIHALWSLVFHPGRAKRGDRPAPQRQASPAKLKEEADL